MSFQEFLQQLVNGLSVGSIYALIALGYTMVYGIIRLINFAHGDIYMLGAYIGFWISGWLIGASPFLRDHVALAILLSVPVAMVICAIIGVAIERGAYKPLRKSPKISLLITAIGISFFLEYMMMLIIGPFQKVYERDDWLSQEFQLGFGVNISMQKLIVILLAVALMIGLQTLVQYTKIGKAMRAVSVDQDAARLMGINVDSVISITFAIGSSLAGAAGVLIGMQYQVQPLMGVMDGLKAFVAAVLGGIGIIPGAAVGSFTLGVVETMVKGLHFDMWGVQPSLLADAVSFIILIIILLVKPAGIFGKFTKEKV